MKIESLLAMIAAKEGCVVHPPGGLPTVRSNEVLTDDLHRFYQVCGGVDLFCHEPYGLRLSGPGELIRSNPEIAFVEEVEDRSDHWYTLGRNSGEPVVVVDLSIQRPGLCYDGHWDCYGVAGSCPIIARSLEELLTFALKVEGRCWYWLQEEFQGLGDAYD